MAHQTRRLLILPLLFSITLIRVATAQWHSIGDALTFSRDPYNITIHSDPAAVAISVLAPDVVRVRMSRTGMFAPDSSWAVVNSVLGNREFALAESDTLLILTTSSGNSVRIRRHPLRIAFFDSTGRVLNSDGSKGMAWAGDQVSVWKDMPQSERYFGFGEKAGTVERRNTMMTNWNSDIPAYTADTDPLYQTIPFFYGMRPEGTYGIFFDNTYQSYFDMGKMSLTEYSFGAAGGELNYYFFFGPTPARVMTRFSELTGKMPLPPLWSLGYQQSRWSYPTAKRVKEIASNFRSRRIPCDVIYCDIDYMDGYRCFTWSNERFPDPAAMTKELGEQGFKVAVIIDPGIKKDSTYSVFNEGLAGGFFAKKPDGEPFLGKVWPGVCAFPDFSSTPAREWWGRQYSDLVRKGIKGFWNDMNEPSVFDVPTKTFDLDVVHDDRGMKSDHRSIHNVYGMQMARGTYEGVLKLNPDERPFVLTRANYAGGQRYTAAWTGDNVSRWEHLKMALGMCMSVSISGQPFIGSDIGGFIGTPDGELFARWLELGVFSPFMRGHSEITAPNKEPWEYGTHYEEINRKIIGMRYQFLPYIYDAFRRSSVSGIPMMRPTAFDFSDDGWTYGNEEQFLFGNALLVAPVVHERSTRKHVRLPKGEWYNQQTDELFSGPKDLDLDAPLDNLPLFVRAGSILPMQPVIQHTGQAKDQPLTVHFYPAHDGSALRAAGSLYEDDGISFAFRSGIYADRSFGLFSVDGGVRISVGKNTGKFKLPSRTITLTMHGVDAQPRSVIVDNRKVAAGESGKSNTWRYDASTHTVSVILNDSDGGHTVDLR